MFKIWVPSIISGTQVGILTSKLLQNMNLDYRFLNPYQATNKDSKV